MIPASVEEIGEGCFAWSGVSRVTFEKETRLECFSDLLFYRCLSLTEIEVPANITNPSRNTLELSDHISSPDASLDLPIHTMRKEPRPTLKLRVSTWWNVSDFHSTVLVAPKVL